MVKRGVEVEEGSTSWNRDERTSSPGLMLFLSSMRFLIVFSQNMLCVGGLLLPHEVIKNTLLSLLLPAWHLGGKVQGREK